MSEPNEIPMHFGPDHWQTEQPTLNLRFVRRYPNGGDDERQVRILQQRWRITEGAHGQFGGVNMRFEWRDVPVEAE